MPSPSPLRPEPIRANPIRVAMVQKQIDHISLQMGVAMTRASRSPIFSESHDFSCFLGDASGEVVGQADGIPIHSGAGGHALRALLSKFEGRMREGDVFILSDPYVAGGNHLPDWTLIQPVFLEGALVGFAANRAHQSDIGGGAAGTYNPEATEIFHEGIRLPVMRYADAGVVRDDVHEMLLLNSRCPDLMDGDLGAMLGTVKMGARRMAETLRRLPAEERQTILADVLRHAETRMRAAIAALPDGVYMGRDGSDTDCFETVEVPIVVTLTKLGETLTVDFTGSSPQVRGFKNSSIANTTAAVQVGVASFFDPSIPRNGGALRPVKIIAPEGTVVNARPPAPMTMNTVYPAIDIIHAIWKALGQAAPGRACAGWGKSVYGSSSGPRPDGSTFVMYHWHGHSGGGAIQGRDGFAQIGHLQSLGGLVLPNVEAHERAYPVRIRKHELRCDAGGPGEFRGGPSVDYVCEVFAPHEHSIRSEGSRRPTGFGAAGGREGLKGSMIVHEAGKPPRLAPQYAVERMGPMVVEIQGSAGGGWGDPFARPPARVLEDVLDGLVSPEAAAADYGVAIAAGPQGPTLDLAATDALRARA